MANLVLRFLLELAALIAMATWGFVTQDNWLLKLLFGLGIPLVMATLWGVFRVPGDGGPPVVVAPSPLRLLLEAVFFALAVGLLAAAGQGTWAAILLALVLVNYIIDWRRTWWFATNRGVPQR